MAELIDWGNDFIRLRLAVDDDARVTLVNFGPTDRLDDDLVERAALGPTEVQFAGYQLPQGSRHVALGGTLSLRYASHTEIVGDGSKTLRLVQVTDSGIRVEQRWQAFDGLPVIRCSVVVTNTSNAPVTLDHVSSFTYNGFARFATPTWSDDVRLAIPHNTLYGEFQWQQSRLPELGIYDVGFTQDDVHSSKKRVSVTGLGTQPTTEFLPMGALTDESRGVAIAWQIEHNGSWHWEVGDHRGAIFVTAGGPTDQEHQWRTRLEPGSSFQSVPVAVTAVVGDLVDVFPPLTRYRRRIRRLNDDDVALPVVFNDFMNSLLAEPTEEKLLPVIAAAARVGSEYFCVDAGWYSNEPGWWRTVGEWEESTTRFPHGFAFVFDAIRAKGMIPGLWIEPEVIGVDSPVVDIIPDSALFWRSGARVNGQGRYQLDFRSPAVVARMDSVIDRLISDYGLGYLKFDYNINGGIGTEVGGVSAGEGLLEHNRAFLAWIDGLFDRHPGLVIEACSSGGARIDYATLARHSILSTSDQTNHYRYVPIAAGAPTGLTPEQAAVWVYPQPEFGTEELWLSIVNGMLSRPQLSGGMWKLSDDQLDVVAEGVRVYKQFRAVIPESTPVWPLGLPGWTDDWIAQGLRSGDELYLAVWRRGGLETVEFTVAGFDGSSSIEVLFPVDAPGTVAWTARGALRVALPKTGSARLLRISTRH